MPHSNQNYIYAYDNDARQIIIINAETGKRVEEKDNSVLPILAYLNEKKAFGKLRKFALWCAYQTNHYIKPMQRKFLELGEKAVQQTADAEELQKLYARSEREAIAIDTTGLRQGSMEAPGFLISRECINPDAFEGAGNAARFHGLWAEMKDHNSTLPDFIQQISMSGSQDVISQAEQQQIDCLLDLMGQTTA